MASFMQVQGLEVRKWYECGLARDHIWLWSSGRGAYLPCLVAFMQWCGVEDLTLI